MRAPRFVALIKALLNRGQSLVNIERNHLPGQGGACVAESAPGGVSNKCHHGGAGRLQAASRSILVAIRARQAVFADPVAKSFT